MKIETFLIPEMGPKMSKLRTGYKVGVELLKGLGELGGGGVGGLLLGRCRAFDLFASVDAHL